ncbi:MAG: transposase [Anaerolineae bacterium]|nr:transposase [Anaerolineae bacterium]
MPQYSESAKQRIIDHLIANNGDVVITSRETGISDRTLLRWRQEYGIQPPDSLSATTTTTTTNAPTEIEIDLTPILDLRTQLITLAETLGQSVPEAIPEAPLNQRVAALAYIIDRLVKVNAMLPKEDDDATPQMEYPITPRPQEDDHENQTEAESDRSQETSDSPAPAPSQPADHS